MIRTWICLIGTAVLYCLWFYSGHVDKPFPMHWVGNADPGTLQK